MNIRHIRLKLGITVAYALLVFLLTVFEVPCLFLTMFGVPCFGCGMTRAYGALFRLDIAGAFLHHPMFWAVPILYLYILLDGRVFRRNWLNNTGLILLGLGFFITWVGRL